MRPPRKTPDAAAPQLVTDLPRVDLGLTPPLPERISARQDQNGEIWLWDERRHVQIGSRDDLRFMGNICAGLVNLGMPDAWERYGIDWKTGKPTR